MTRRLLRAENGVTCAKKKNSLMVIPLQDVVPVMRANGPIPRGGFPHTLGCFPRKEGLFFADNIVES